MAEAEAKAETKAKPEEYVCVQPRSTAPMTAGGNKNALNRPVGPDGLRGWSYSLFGCFSDCGFCCFTVLCPCIAYSRNKQHLRNLQYQGTPLLAANESMDTHCCIYGGLVLTGYPWLLQLRPREEIRERYGIRGGPCTDCLASCCCCYCALTQEHREIVLEERNFK